MILLGSTGSIGVNALEIASLFDIPIEAISAGKNIDLLNTQIAKYRPQKVAISSHQDLYRLNAQGAKIYVGNEGICEMIFECSSSLVLNALVGFVGLNPTLTTLETGKKLALANKESLVTAGWLVDASSIIPIDSEHFGLWYLYNKRPIKKLIITASGGAFRDTPIAKIPSKNVNEALLHPNWKMGKKITIDSATMVNKLFEVLEAKWLFGIDNIEGLIERRSNVHALIEFVDGSITAHFACPDMKLPIAYGINPKKASEHLVIPCLELEKLSTINFEKIDENRYPLWALKNTLIQNPKLGVVLNAANEIAVKNFIEGRISFGKIFLIIEKSLQKFDNQILGLQSYGDILALDKEVRAFANLI